jgi:large subunit ribosomal protein L31
VANQKEQTKQEDLIYFGDVVATCSCGATYKVGSTQKEIKVEICSACHPFYTGNQKFIDSGGRLEHFKARVEAGKAGREQTAKKLAKKAEKQKEKEKDDETAND